MAGEYKKQDRRGQSSDRNIDVQSSGRVNVNCQDTSTTITVIANATTATATNPPPQSISSKEEDEEEDFRSFSDIETEEFCAGLAAHTPQPGTPPVDRRSILEVARAERAKMEKEELNEQIRVATKNGAINPFKVRREKGRDGKWGYHDEASWLKGMNDEGQEGLMEKRCVDATRRKVG